MRRCHDLRLKRGREGGRSDEVTKSMGGSPVFYSGRCHKQGKMLGKGFIVRYSTTLSCDTQQHYREILSVAHMASVLIL